MKITKHYFILFLVSIVMLGNANAIEIHPAKFSFNNETKYFKKSVDETLVLSLKHHRMVYLGNNERIARERACTGYSGEVRRYNLYLNTRLQVDKVYYLNSSIESDETRYGYFLVKEAYDTPHNDTDGAYSPNPLLLNINCSQVFTLKHHRMVNLGTSETIAKQRKCNGYSGTVGRHNLYLGNKLQVGQVYYLNSSIENDETRYSYFLIKEAYDTPHNDTDGAYSVNPRFLDIKCDRDGDGVEDNQDNCPNVAGPASNNGCPVLPNLKLKSLKVKNTTTNSTIFNFPNGNTNTPTLNKGNYYDFIIEVENNISGSGTANSVSLDMLLNTSATLYPDPRANVYNVSTDSNIGNVNSNSSIIKTFSVYVSNTIGSSPSLSNGSGYTLSFDIDSKGRISESNENDNINQLQFIYSSSRSNTISALKPSNHKPYEVSVFNISGTQVTKKIVVDKEEENTFTKNLPKGFYIIKNGTETYKIVK